MKSMNWFYLALVTVACWGLYGIYLHQGQVAMADKEHIGGCSGRVIAEALSGIRGAERQEGWPRREDAWVVEARW